VPQAIYLSDSSIEENIAFGIPKEKIDFERVVLAARQAQIAETIQSWPSGYQTLVGERGVRLSGGQRQRIGIARALYKNADVLIFDEATSALDSDTEQAVMDAFQTLSFDVTILIIAHRLTTLKDCDQIVELDGGQIIRVGTYDDIVTQVFNRR
jgi:ATP-binding cassette subfamily B protein